MENPHLYKMMIRSYDTSAGLRYRGKSARAAQNENNDTPKTDCILDDKIRGSLDKLSMKSTAKYQKQDDVSYFDYFARSIVGFGKQIADCLNETSQTAYETIIRQGVDYVDVAYNQLIVDIAPEPITNPEPFDIGLNASSTLTVPSTEYEVVHQEAVNYGVMESEVKKTKVDTMEMLANDVEKEPEPEKEMEQGLDSEWSNDLDNGWGSDVRHELESKSETDAKEESAPEEPPKQAGTELESNLNCEMDINTDMRDNSKDNFKVDVKCESFSEEREKCKTEEKDNAKIKLDHDLADKENGSSSNKENSALHISKSVPTIQATPVKSPLVPKHQIATPKPLLKDPIKPTPQESSTSSTACELSPAKDDYLKQAEQRIRAMLAKKGVNIPQYLIKPNTDVPLTRPLNATDLTSALTIVVNEQLIKTDDTHIQDRKIMMDSSGLQLDAALANIFGHNFLMQRTPACSILPGTLPSSLSAVSIVAPNPGKSCISKPDMFEHVPIFPDHATTPASTPFKRSDFGQRPYPPQLPSGIPRRRRPFINLAIPRKQPKKVTYAKVLINEKKSFDDVVNSGQSGFRILSKHDKNCSTVEYPAYVAPEE